MNRDGLPASNNNNDNNFKNGFKRPRKFNMLKSNQVFRIIPRGQKRDELTPPQGNTDDIQLITNWGFPDQIVRYYREKGITRFFPWQVEALEQPGVLDRFQNLVYSAPTSAGKTMVSDVLLYKNILERKKKAIIILPFVSITVEKVESLKKVMKRIGVRIDKFSGNTNPKGGFAQVDVAVCTIEKANNMINRLIEEGNLSDVGLVIVDELHMLGDGSRGYLLELLLTKILFHSKRSTEPENLVQIVGMSATIPNLPDISRWLDAQLYITEYRPVPLYERIVQVIDENAAVVAEYDKDNPIEDFKVLPPIDTRELGINHDDSALIYTAIETVIDGYSALIFCPTKLQCEKFSREIAFNIYEFGAKKKLQTSRAKEFGEKIFDRIKPNIDKIRKLMESLKKSQAGLDPQLEESIRFGVAFHHAGMSTDERSAVEEAFRNGVIKILCSTTTLSAGVNLPARRVLITSPFNYRGDQLMDIITYRQMIGRAGRKGIDELGEAYMFCRSKDLEHARLLVRSHIKPIKSCLLQLQCSSSSSEDSNSNSMDLITVVMSESLKKAIIEIIANGIAANKSDIIEYCKCTFFNESFRSRLSEDEQRTGSHFEAAIDQVFEYLITNQLIYLNNNPDTDALQARVYVSNLGKAIVASGILPDDGRFIQKELDRARNNLSLVNDLHLVYQVTPTYISNQLDSINWHHYLDLWQKLTPEEKLIADKIGISPAYLVSRCNSNLNQKNAKQMEKYLIHKRFYASLALHDLIQEIPLVEVARKYRMVKGQIQSLQQQAATFAGMLATFCNKLGWFSMELLIEQFQPRLAFGVQRELIDLMRITFLPITVARSLFKNYQTLKDMVYERSEDIERSIVQGLAFDATENCDPKTRLLFVPALEQHFTISEFATKILEEARDIIQTEIGQPINFEPPDSATQTATTTTTTTTTTIDTNNSTQNIRISPIKVKKIDPEIVAEKTIGHVSSSTPVVLDRSKTVCGVAAGNPPINMSLDELFDDSFEFSFGATPNKQSRLEKTSSATPSVASKNFDAQSGKNRSSKKLNFVIDDNDLRDAGPSNCPITNRKECIKIFEVQESKKRKDNNDESMLSLDHETIDNKSSNNCEDYDAIFDDNLNDLSWTDMIDKVKNTSSSSSSTSSSSVRFKKPSPKKLKSTNDMNTSCILKNNDHNDNDDDKNSVNEQQYNRLFDELTTTNNLIIPNRMDPLSSNQDSGAPKTSDFNTTLESPFDDDDDDDEDYLAIFNNNKTKNVTNNMSTNVNNNPVEKFDNNTISENSTNSDSFKFEEDITLDDIDELFVNQQKIKIEPAADIDDECSSSSSVSFFETFQNNLFNTIPDCLQHQADIIIDKLSLNNVTSIEVLENLIQFINDNPLNLVFHFVVKPYTEPVNIVHKSHSRRSIINFLEPKPVNGLVIRDFESFELYEMFITTLGQSTVYRLDSSEYFLLFIDKFRTILSRIEPLFDDGSRSPFSVKSTASDSPKFIRFFSYDIKLCIHLFARAFRLPVSALVRRIEWYDLSVAVWLLDPEDECFKIQCSTVQDLIQLTLTHSLDQSFIQKIRLYELSLNRENSDVNNSKTNYNNKRNKKNEDSPQIGMIKTVMLPNLMKLFLNKLIEKNLYKSYQMIEIPSRLLFAIIEMRGIQIDDIVLEFENKRITKFMSYLEKKIYRLVGHEFNLASPDQVAKVLFQDHSLLSNYFNVTKLASSSRAFQTTKQGTKRFSTNKLAMSKLQEACGNKTKLPTMIMEWRKLSHCYNNSVLPLRHWLTGNQLVYCHLEEWSSTGRISMTDPNLINLEKEFQITEISVDVAKKLMENDDDDDKDYDSDSFEFNKSILSPTKSVQSPVSGPSRPVKIRLRKTVIAREGYCLISADYRQLELRIMAHFCKDKQLLASFDNPSDDVFRCIASSWLKIDRELVTNEARQQAKQICYGVIYGMGMNSLAENLAVSLEEAKEFHKSFIERYPSIQDFKEKTIESCHENEYIEMLSNRRRLLPHINSDNSVLSSKAQRQAVHSVIQGSAADCIKLAMIAVDSAIRRAGFDASLILQIHDELMYEVADNPELPDCLKPIQFARLLKTQMEDVSKHLKVNMQVKVQSGSSWGDLQEIQDL